MDIYSDLKATDGLIKQQDYGKQDTSGDNTRLVKPSDQDFLCDVEISLRRVLPTPLDKKHLTAMLAGETVEPSLKSKIKQRVGRELIRRNIHPVSDYFRGIEVQRAR